MKEMAKLPKKLAIALPILALSFLGAASVFAQAPVFTGQTSPVLTNPLGSSCQDLTCPAQRVADFLFTIAIPITGIMILVGGFQIMTAAGNPEKVSTGKKTLLYAVIGFVVILLAGSVATLIQNTLGGP